MYTYNVYHRYNPRGRGKGEKNQSSVFDFLNEFEYFDNSKIIQTCLHLIILLLIHTLRFYESCSKGIIFIPFEGKKRKKLSIEKLSKEIYLF